MKKPIVVLSNDWHIKDNNVEIITDLFTQKCELAKRLNVSTLIVAGDIFDSRISQKLIVLKAFSDLLHITKKYGLDLIVIPGNHDKTSYNSVSSFLTPFVGHSNFRLIETPQGKSFGDVDFLFLPFFKEDVILELMAVLEKPKAKINILITHLGLTGSVNNDGSTVKNNLNVSLFKDFTKIFSGHYHDQQQIGSNFFHTPSIRQNNFGEDSDKGFTVIYDDGSHELIKSKFKEYVKVTLDVSVLSKKEIELKIEKYSKLLNDCFVRLEFIGDELTLSEINRGKYLIMGFDVKIKIKGLSQITEQEESEEFCQMNSEEIEKEFIWYCENNSIDNTLGLKFLKKCLYES